MQLSVGLLVVIALDDVAGWADTVAGRVIDWNLSEDCLDHCQSVGATIESDQLRCDLSSLGVGDAGVVPVDDEDPVTVTRVEEPVGQGAGQQGRQTIESGHCGSPFTWTCLRFAGILL